MKGQSKFMTS